jgi:hypothetical protein
MSLIDMRSVLVFHENSIFFSVDGETHCPLLYLSIAEHIGLVVLEIFLVNGPYGEFQLIMFTKICLYEVPDISFGRRKYESFVCIGERRIIDFMVLMEHDDNLCIPGWEYDFLLFFWNFEISLGLYPKAVREGISLWKGIHIRFVIQGNHGAEIHKSCIDFTS